MTMRNMIGAALRAVSPIIGSDSLRRDLRDACRAAGFSMPSQIRLTPQAGSVEIFHPLAHARARMRNADGDIHPDLVEAVRTVAGKISIGEIRGRIMEQLTETSGIPPAWTRLVHPLALRLVLEDIPDRNHGPHDWQRARSRTSRISDFECSSRPYGTEEFSRMMLMKADDRSKVEAVFTFLPDEDGRQRVQFAVTRIVPEAVAALMPGRRLVDLVEITPIGHEDIDQEVEGLIVDRVEPQKTSTVMTLAPTRWIPWQTPPGQHHGWDEQAPFMA